MREAIPDFEGRPVETALVKMTGNAPLDDLADIMLSVDDVVSTLTVSRVVGVHHKVDEKTGKLIRVATLKPVELVLSPSNPNDPNDEGITRALPYNPTSAAATAATAATTGADDE